MQILPRVGSRRRRGHPINEGFDISSKGDYKDRRQGKANDVMRRVVGRSLERCGDYLLRLMKISSRHQNMDRKRRDVFIVAITTVIFVVLPFVSVCASGDSSFFSGKGGSEFSILIPLYDFSTVDDVGGWLHPQKSPQIPTSNVESNKLVNFGDVTVHKLKKTFFQRQVNPSDENNYNHERQEELELMDQYLIPAYYYHDDELDQEECRRPNWKMLYFPNCNTFHEMDLSRPYDRYLSSMRDANFDTYRFSHGYYRDAWLVEHPEFNESVVLKTLRTKHDFTTKTLSTVQRDSIVMERLTASEYIIDIYGHCGASLSVEQIAYEVEDSIVPEGYIKQEDLMDTEELQPQNQLTPIEKLEMALIMAQSLAVLHGYDGGVIVHDDIQLCQWLRTREGKLVLGDFNRAEIMDWSPDKKQYCKYNNGYAYGNYRSPEEFAGRDLDQAIDVFSLGNNFYGLLTGLWPFYENEDDGVVQKLLIDGKTSLVDKRYREKSLAEGYLVEMIERCWAYEPAERPDVFEIVEFLQRGQETIHNLEQHGGVE